MAISTVGFVAGLDIGYGNVKGVGGSLTAAMCPNLSFLRGLRRSAP